MGLLGLQAEVDSLLRAPQDRSGSSGTNQSPVGSLRARGTEERPADQTRASQDGSGLRGTNQGPAGRIGEACCLSGLGACSLFRTDVFIIVFLACYSSVAKMGDVIKSVEEILNKRLEGNELSEIKRILYGKDLE